MSFRDTFKCPSNWDCELANSIDQGGLAPKAKHIWVLRYCAVGGHANCARRVKYAAGETPPQGLWPDGLQHEV